MIETLINRARTYIYTTALPPAVASAALAALDIVDAQPQQRAHLHALIARFREGAQALKLPLLDSFTPIQPVVIGDAARAVGAADALFERGILVAAIRPPTVPRGTARLRVTLS